MSECWEQYTSLAVSSNMVLIRMNHCTCTHSNETTDCLQCSAVKSKLLCKFSKDCEEITVCSSLSVNAVNLVSLLVMPIIPKFNVYGR